MKILLLAVVLLLLGCSQEDVSRAANAIGESYVKSHRDSTIRNWQSRISDFDRCSEFKARMKEAGIRHQSAASGLFVMDMQKIMSEAKQAQCEYQP